MSYFHSEISIPSNTNKKLRLDAHNDMQSDYTFIFPAQIGENNSIMIIDENDAASWTKDISINDISAVNFDISYVNAKFIDVSAMHANNINVASDFSATRVTANSISLNADNSVLSFGADSDITLTHVADTGLLTNGNLKLKSDNAGNGGIQLEQESASDRWNFNILSSDNRAGLFYNGNTRYTFKAGGQFEIYQQSNDRFSGLKLIRSGTGNDWVLTNIPALGLYFYYGSDIRGVLYNTISVGQIDFTGQHRSLLNRNIDNSSIGLIVSSTGKYVNLDNTLNASINESLPVCVVTTTDNDKKVFGVLSDKEDTENTRNYSSGNWGSVYTKQNINEQRMFINSLGEGAIWVSNKNGNLENGDYITSSTVPGYGMKQADGLLHNYTVAKITCHCVFSTTKIVKQN